MSATNTTKRSHPSQRRYVAGGSSTTTTRRVIDRVAGASNPPPVLVPCHAWMTLSGGMSSRNCWGPTTPTPPPHVGRRSLSSNE